MARRVFEFGVDLHHPLIRTSIELEEVSFGNSVFEFEEVCVLVVLIVELPK